jgi:hypothetical protein
MSNLYVPINSDTTGILFGEVFLMKKIEDIHIENSKVIFLKPSIPHFRALAKSRPTTL